MVVKKIIKMPLLLIIFIAAMAENCSKYEIWRRDELSIQRTSYTGDQLRIDGYYYYKWGNPERATIYCFYNNGVILHLGDGIKMSEINQFEQTITTIEFIEKVKEDRQSWGVFKIEGNTMQFERWYPSSGGSRAAYVRAGTILNDTTFTITGSYRMKDGKKTEVKDRNETYHFKQFSPKPDSTNIFVP